MHSISDTNKPIYFSALDGLRAFALAGVIFQHFVNDNDKGWLVNLHFGSWGVSVFFVLSGFLIGNILIQQRYQKERTKESMWTLLKIFYIRRSLRIFPIYYLLLVLMVLIGLPSYIYDYVGWYASYTANFKLIIDGFTVWPTSHFWTLSIEEQFYIIFPLVLFITPVKHMFKMIIGFILVGVFSKMILHFQYNYFYDYFTLSAFDYFGFGILLAYMRIHGIPIKYSSLLLALFLGLYVHLSFPIMDHPGKSFLLKTLPIAPFIFFLVVYKTITDWGQSRVLNLPMLRYTGKISYGLYLYHPFIPYIRSYFIEIPNTAIALSVDIILVFVVSTFSFYGIERPINNLKKKFEY